MICFHLKKLEKKVSGFVLKRDLGQVGIYIYIHTHTHTHTYIYIYIYRERERERERESDSCFHSNTIALATVNNASMNSGLQASF